MPNDRVRAVLKRLEHEDANERQRGLSAPERSRAVARTTGQFLFGLVAPQWDCEVLEVGASRGYSTLWLAAGVRYLGGHVTSPESDPPKVDAWPARIPAAGLDDLGDPIQGGPAEANPGVEDGVRLV